jgi:(S)-sulfolactate dehydrogenase
MRIVISEFMDDDAVAWLAQRHETLFDATLVDDPGRLRDALATADALLIRNRTQVTAELLRQAPALRVVGRLGVGLDNVDVAACRARDVRVIPAVGANAQAVAEYVICTAMLLLRRAYQHSAAVGQGDWPRSALSQGRELAGKRLGIVGFGSIGRRVAELAVALGMEVCASARNGAALMDGVAQCSLEELVATSAVITLHVPRTAATRGLFDRSRLLEMQRGAVLINTARGGIVDEAALAELLHLGHLGGAAVDVFEDEPLRPGSPLANAPNVILTPHIAGLTVESNQRVSRFVASAVDDYLRALGGAATPHELGSDGD